MGHRQAIREVRTIGNEGESRRRNERRMLLIIKGLPGKSAIAQTGAGRLFRYDGGAVLAPAGAA
jgi:hypothetical protein